MSMAAVPSRPRLALFAGVLLLGPLGCGGGKTGDGAYSQKFDMPAGAASAPAQPQADPYDERSREIQAAQQEPSQPKKRGARPRR
jgi:hypothetical protein